MPAEKILIVEDKQSVMRLMKSNLEQMGYQNASTVSTGEEAIEAAGKLKPDIVLMDIELQGAMDGIEAAKQIRLEFGLPAIFVGADQSDHTIERTQPAEPIGFIPKPFIAENLHAAIETGLRSYNATNSRIQKAVQFAENHYCNLIESITLGAFHLDCSEEFVAVNSAFAKILGYASPEELRELAPDAKQHFVNPECREELLDSIRKYGYVKDFEFQVYRKDGSKIWLAQTTRARYDFDDDEPYFEGVVQDISERKQKEDMLHALMARQAALLAAVPDIIMEVDVNKVYTWANNAGLEFFGNDVIGKDASYYFAGDQETYTSVSPIFEGSQNSAHIESWQLRKDGSKRLLAWRRQGLKDHSGKVIGALSSARDITEDKLAEQDRLRVLTRSVLLNQLQRDLLSAGELSHKLKMITEGMVDIFEADFCRIWLKGPGDLCELGCVHAAVQEGPNVCRHRDMCLRMIASSGRYTHTNGDHQRIPFDTYKIGCIASGKEHLFLTNDVASDLGIRDHDWTKKLGLVSFAGFQLWSPDGECLGVLALFSTHAITPEEQAQMDALSGAASQVILAAQAEAALRQSEERFRLITEHIDEVFWVSDLENNAIYISPAFERVWGIPRENLYKSVELFRKAIHPEDRQRVLATFALQKDGRPIDLEYRIVLPDGSIRHIWDRGFPISDQSGHPQKYVGVAQDVTQRRHAEEDLKKSKEYLNQIINRIGDPIFVKDRQHRFLIANDAVCATIGLGREEFIGNTLYNTQKKEVMDLLYEQEERVFETGEAIVNVDEIKGVDGRHYTMMSNTTLLTDEAGNKQLVCVLRDITDMKKAEKEREELEIQLRQAQKLEAIGQLAAGIAHEINTPIQYVSDNTRFMQDAFGAASTVLEAYERLLQAVRRGPVVDPSLIAGVEAAIAKADLDYLVQEAPRAVTQSLEGLKRVATIVRAMKEFSHPGGEEKQTIDLNHAIENTVTVCRNEWKYVAEMVMDLDPTLSMVPCLPGDLNQVTLNLVVNAAHAIADAISGTERSKGTIRISTRQDRDWVEIRIGDTGTGIPEEHRGKIFTPFFTTKEVGKGTGQGLAISRAVVVSKHGGTIRYETEVGKGTTFIIRLPLHSSSMNKK
jgi:PAS domain S-box-containing protein